MNTNTDALRYAGLYPRLNAKLWDLVICSPFFALIFWGNGHSRLFPVYFTLPSILFGVFYSVYLVKRYGGTPGKLIAGIRIRKVDATQVGYREALLRYLPEVVLGTLDNVAWIVGALQISDAVFYSGPFWERFDLQNTWWSGVSPFAWGIWIVSGIIVFFANKERRALHDFIAGTVVVHVSRAAAPQPPTLLPRGA